MSSRTARNRTATAASPQAVDPVSPTGQTGEQTQHLPVVNPLLHVDRALHCPVSEVTVQGPLLELTRLPLPLAQICAQLSLTAIQLGNTTGLRQTANVVTASPGDPVAP